VTSPDTLDGTGYDELVRRALEGIEHEQTRALIAKRLKVLDPAMNAGDARQLVSEHSITSKKETNARVAAQRVKELQQAMCEADDAPFVARGFIYNGRIVGAGDRTMALVETLRSATCRGAIGLDASDLAELQRIERQARRRDSPDDQEQDK
jgi:hypothetical protein